jgi:hypothetical protein
LFNIKKLSNRVAAQGWGSNKDVKNEGCTGNVTENKRNGETADDRSGWFDEKKAVMS